MFKFWPAIVAVCKGDYYNGKRLETDEQVRAAMCDYIGRMTTSKTGDIKMNKKEAKKEAEKFAGTIDNLCKIEDVEGYSNFTVSIAESFLRLFPYTPEPKPIKYGVLCVGEGRSTGIEHFGRFCGNDALGNDKLACFNGTHRVKNARPITPADLAKWGWEEE
ncbi:MAG: hypothetical protein ACYTBJ_17735 [Planctomycetota bacterium]|jgi:hypothetical protein